MQITIGINANHADSSACIIIGDQLVAAIEEERLNRIKHYSGFPYLSIKECIKIAGLKENEITDIAFNTKPLSNLYEKSKFFIKNLSLNNNLLSKIKKKINLKDHLKHKFTFNTDIKFHFVEHHLSHIASSFFPSNFNKAYGLSIDGSGDFTSFAIANCENDEIKILERIYFPNSLGIFYHAMTQFLGFAHYGSEYKVMGMAAYGNPLYFNKIKNNLFKKAINQVFELNLKYFNHQKNSFKYIADGDLVIDKIYNEELKKLFSKDINQSKNYDEFSYNFASSVQKIYEFYFEEILKKMINEKFSENLVYSGGCALNSSANRLLTKNNKYFKNIFIPYAPGDNGGAIGAALVVHNKNINMHSFKTPYTGPKFSNYEIKNVLLSKSYQNKIRYSVIMKDSELYKRAAFSISEGKVVGWFQDKMEFGPRALGNRSILADPRNLNMKDIINKKIKRRESFRPFAPAILEQYQDQWFESIYLSHYMSTVATVKKKKRELIPAVTHVDGTGRLQSVNYKLNPKFYGLIEEFNKITKVPILLNTSFNENEPIVMKPEEALDCLLRTDLDELFIENYYISKI